MSEILISAEDAEAPVPVHLVEAGDLEQFWAEDDGVHDLILAQGFKAKAGSALVLPGAGGKPAAVLFGLGDADAAREGALRALPSKLEDGDYVLRAMPEHWDPTQAAAAFALGAYAFDRYKARSGGGRPRLAAPKEADLDEARRIAHACALVRDMVNTPANDMGPLQVETIAREIAARYGAQIAVVAGPDLLEAGYPAIHAVGRAATSERAPRLIEMTWGEAGPHIVLVGKGVVFDSGGLDIKPSSGMRLMKKDMGGAAHALGLARMVMDAGLKLRLTVLLPVVENAISGDAFRPGDVLATRAGLTVEVGNTDAEGRLILADALTRAGELAPDLTIDLATLTGAARIALGPQLPPFYTDDDALAAEIAAAGDAAADPVWRMPLWAGYAEAVESDIADLRNDGEAWAQAGSVIAALFLKRFAPAPWAHFDIFAWNPKSRAGHPVGGEAQAIRGLYAMLKARAS